MGINEIPDLSLAQGGPTYKLFCWSRLSDIELHFVERRTLVIMFIAWAPLFFLSLFDGLAFGSAVKVTFLTDITAQIRFFVVLPIFIAAEPYVYQMIAARCREFISRNIVQKADRQVFAEAIQKAHRIRNSWILELGVLLSVYLLGLQFWKNQIALQTPTWYANPSGDALNLTLAGYWYVFIAIPIVQFFTVRWCARLVIWFLFLWRVSRLDLNLIVTHPDRAGGLSFLGKATYAFGPILFAQGATLSGFIANEVIYNDRQLLDFRPDVVLVVLFLLLTVFTPLCVFIPQLVRAKREGLATYGELSSLYVEKFEKRWINRSGVPDDEILGSGDIQSLADLGNSYTVVREMNMAPFSYHDVIRLAIVTVAPLLPLALLKFSPEEIVERIFQVLL